MAGVTAVTLYATGAAPLLDRSEPAEAPSPSATPSHGLPCTGVGQGVGTGRLLVAAPGERGWNCGCGAAHSPVGAVLLWVWAEAAEPLPAASCRDCPAVPRPGAHQGGRPLWVFAFSWEGSFSEALDSTGRGVSTPLSSCFWRLTGETAAAEGH